MKKRRNRPHKETFIPIINTHRGQKLKMDGKKIRLHNTIEQITSSTSVTHSGEEEARKKRKHEEQLCSNAHIQVQKLDFLLLLLSIFIKCTSETH